MSTKLPGGVRPRSATAADDGAIRALLVSSSLASDAEPLPPGERYVAEAGGTIVGVAMLQQFGGDALLRVACVHSAWRGQGIGTTLLEHVLTAAALAALDTVAILAPGAGGFFARFGFREVTRSEIPDPVRRAAERGASEPSMAIPMLLRLADS